MVIPTGSNRPVVHSGNQLDQVDASRQDKKNENTETNLRIQEVAKSVLSTSEDIAPQKKTEAEPGIVVRERSKAIIDLKTQKVVKPVLSTSESTAPPKKPEAESMVMASEHPITSLNTEIKGDPGAETAPIVQSEQLSNEQIRLAKQTLESVLDKYGILNESDARTIGLALVKSADARSSGNKICLNHIHTLDGVSQAITSPAKGALCVVLEREDQDDDHAKFLEDKSELKRILSDRAQNSILIVMKSVDSNLNSTAAEDGGFLNCYELNDDGTKNPIKTRASIPSSQAQDLDGCQEVSTRHSIFSENFDYLILPENLASALKEYQEEKNIQLNIFRLHEELPQKNDDGVKILLVPDKIYPGLEFNRAHYNVRCPDYLEGLQKIWNHYNSSREPASYPKKIFELKEKIETQKAVITSLDDAILDEHLEAKEQGRDLDQKKLEKLRKKQAEANFDLMMLEGELIGLEVESQTDHPRQALLTHMLRYGK